MKRTLKLESAVDLEERLKTRYEEKMSPTKSMLIIVWVILIFAVFAIVSTRSAAKQNVEVSLEVSDGVNR
jgi:hypothetical protein